MKRGGEAAFALCRSFYPDARRWLILYDHGNNSGNGYVIARVLNNMAYLLAVIRERLVLFSWSDITT